MLKAIENISLFFYQKVVPKNPKHTVIKTGAKKVGKSEDNQEQKYKPKCFSCNTMGHIAAKCKKPKREKGACFKCYQMGHKSKDYPVKESTSKNKSSKDSKSKKTDVSSVFGEQEDFYRDVSYQMYNSEEQCKLISAFDTLLDTGSPISYFKDIHVLINLVVPALLKDNKYTGK